MAAHASSSPLVSVIVPLFNRQDVVGSAIASLTPQTLEDIEIIVVDDGSTDKSVDVAERAGDRRLRVIRHGTNRGIPAARNSGLEAARGKFIAWLDSDDLARATRLAQQVEALERHPELALIGSAAGRVDRRGIRKRGAIVPLLEHRAIAPGLLFRSPFQQSTVMGRAAILKDYPFRAEFPVCEDLDVFIRVARDHRVANLRDVLVDRRIHDDQIGRLESARVRDLKRTLLSEQLDELEVEYSAADLDRHITLGAPKNQPQTAEMLDWTRAWLESLRQANQRRGRYDPDGLALASSIAWATLCRATMRGPARFKAVRSLAGSSLTRAFANPAGRAWLSEAAPTLLRALI